MTSKAIQMNKTLIFPLLLLFSNLVDAKLIEEAQIRGIINNAFSKTLTIDNTPVPIFGNGKFSFNARIERPNFYDINYDGLEWSVYLEPGSRIECLLPEKNISSIMYKGNLASPNFFLIKAALLNKTVSDFLDKNWVQIYSQSETRFVSVVDSLKGVFLKPFSLLLEKDKTIPGQFIKLFKSDVNYGLDWFILRYPENHFIYTGEQASLSKATLEFLDSNIMDDPAFMELQSYQRFCRKYIDYKADLLVDENGEPKQYDLRKMDAIFQILPEIFTRQLLLDFWMSEYLFEHIQNCGMANCGEYIRDFRLNCKTELYKKKINEFCATIMEGQKDHSVKTYKSANGFNLQAHIFSPEGIKKGEKRPAIVIFHGGGWNGGNPSWAFNRAKHFKDSGMVAVAAQYRLTNRKDVTAVECMADARDLIKWMRSNSDSLNILSDKIVAYGWSAGAHLASSAAIFSDSIPAQKINSIPNALILVSPAVSLPSNMGWKYSVLGPAVAVNSVNPVEHVRKELPPTIILQGKEDTVTPLDGVKLFHDKMLENGNYCELWIYDGVGHLFTPNSMPDNGEPHPDIKIEKEAFKKADQFLTKFGYIY
jgi:acetyl esterase